MTKTCNKVFVLFTILVMVGLACCNRIDCLGGTMEGKPEPYKGEPESFSPYADEHPILQMGPGSCSATVCDYFPLAILRLHNPTAKDVIGDVSCTFFMEDWNAGKNTRKGVKVLARGSKRVEIQYNMEVPTGHESSVGVSCEVEWKK